MFSAPSLRSRVLGLKPGMRPHSSSPQMTNAPISCEIRAPGQPSPRTAHRRTYTSDEILEMALWCHPLAQKCYLRELLNLSSLAGPPRVFPAVTTLRLESLFADGNLSHQRWLSVPYHGSKIPRFTPASSMGSKSESALSIWTRKLFLERQRGANLRRRAVRCSRALLCEEHSSPGQRKSCEICIGRCPVAAAFHKCRAGESDEFLSATDPCIWP